MQQGAARLGASLGATTASSAPAAPATPAAGATPATTTA